MITFKSYKIDKRQYIFIAVIVLLYFFSWAFNIKPFDFWLFLGTALFILVATIILSFNQGNNEITFYDNYIYFRNSWDDEEINKKIYYKDIIKVGHKEKRSYVIYIITSDQAFPINCDIKDIIKFYGDLKQLKEKKVLVEDSILKVLLKTYFKSTQYSRYSIVSLLLLTAILNILFFSIPLIIWMIIPGFGIVLWSLLYLLENDIATKMSKQENIIHAIQNRIQRHEKRIFLFSSILFSMQVISILISILY